MSQLLTDSASHRLHSASCRFALGAHTSAHEDIEAELQTLHLGWVVSRIDGCVEMSMGTSGTFPKALNGPMRRAALGHGVRTP